MGAAKPAKSSAFQILKKIVGEAMRTGAAAALRGDPITQCPFGVCKGPEDESHDDVQISSWVIGYLEEAARKDIEKFSLIGMHMAHVHAEKISVPSPANSRVMAALIEGFTSEVVQFDIVEYATLQ